VSRLRVVHVGKYYPPYRGGMESHLATLCRALAAHADVTALVSAAGPRTVRERDGDVDVVRLARPLALAGAAINPGLVRALRETPADVVHVHHPNPTAVLAYLASGSRAPLVVTYHSDIVRQRVLGAVLGPLLDHFLGRASAIVASSERYAEGSRVLRRHRDRVRIVPFGVDESVFAPPDPAEVAALRRTHGDRVVLGVGRLVYYKGFEYLVQAMAEVPGTLVIVGDGPLRGRLAELAAAPAVRGRVHLVGEAPRVAPYYRAADVFALPATERSEAFGLVQVEAMAAGLPVVNTAIDSGVPYVSPAGETGLTVPPRDVAALAAALRALLGDAALRRRFGDAGRRRARERFGLDRMVGETLSLYHEVAARPR
jgi:glycosyltransferase involved in cell wall biosynthesis